MKLPNVNSRECMETLHKAGYVVVRTQGSHFRLKRADGRVVTVPHKRQLQKGVIRMILRQAELTTDEFNALRGKA